MDRQSSPSALAFCTPSTSVSSRGILPAATTAAMLPLVTPKCCLARTWVNKSLCCSTSSPWPSSLCNRQTGSQQVCESCRQCVIVSRCSEPLKAWRYIALLAGCKLLMIPLCTMESVCATCLRQLTFCMLPKCSTIRSPLATALHAIQPDKYALPAQAYIGYTAPCLYLFAPHESVGVAKFGD